MFVAVAGRTASFLFSLVSFFMLIDSCCLSYFAGISKDELFGQFFDALEKTHYFRSLPDGNDDQAQLDKASRIFHTALEVYTDT